jgi:hypothetical protein
VASDLPLPTPEETRLREQTLDYCIQAERKVRGSADQIIARQPAGAQAELRHLLDLALALDQVATQAVSQRNSVSPHVSG